MRFNADDPVRLRQERVSRARGRSRAFAEGSVGRVCKTYPSGLYCVQFATQCLRISQDFLEPASEPAPDCSKACKRGC